MEYLKSHKNKPYKSLFSDLYVDAANHLAEIVCKRKAEKENTGSLPQKFWNTTKYKNLYIREISQAKNLLKKYNEIAIINALNSFKARFILSLRNKKLIPIIEEEQNKLPKTEFISDDTTSEKHRIPLPKSKIKDL